MKYIAGTSLVFILATIAAIDGFGSLMGAVSTGCFGVALGITLFRD